MNEQKQDVGMLVCHVSHQFRRLMDRNIAAASNDPDEPFSGRNLWVLRYVREREGTDVFQRDLERAFKVRRSTISRMVDLMVQKQYLIREPVEGDQRLKRLRLTPKAERMMEDVRQSTETLEAELRDSFAPEEYRTLTELLLRLSDTLEEKSSNPERKES